MKKIDQYHIHIYFDLDQITIAHQLREKIQSELNFLDGISKLREIPVGPHPKPMFLAWFKTQYLDEVKQWAHTNCTPIKFSALIHPLTDDDFYDHADEQVYWIGDQLVLDTSAFL